MRFLYLVLFVFMLASCEFEQIQFKGIEDFKMPKIDDKEILLDLAFKVNNPNKFKIKVKPSNVDLFISDSKLGTVYLDDKVVFKKKAEGVYKTSLRLKLADGIFFELMKLMGKKEIPLRIKGKVKGSVYGISKKMDIDRIQTISGDQLNFFNKSK